MKTAIETLIDELTKSAAEARRRVEEFSSKEMPTSKLTSGAMAIAYDMAIKKATELLETEKKQIVEAFDKSREAKIERETDDGDSYYDVWTHTYDSAEEYFNDTYKK